MRSIPRGDTFININRYTRCHVAVSQRFENTPRASCVSARNTPPMINGQKRRERWAFGIFSLIYPRFVCSPFWIRSSFFFPLVVAKPSSSLLRISVRRVIARIKVIAHRTEDHRLVRPDVYDITREKLEKFEYIRFPMIIWSLHFYTCQQAVLLFLHR